ncbi:MAG: (Fe-S)-binding protein [Acidobacteria bacterium]|nr:(Fe-S)-binding protein [Acidobacteriota bacterium]
MGSHVGTDASRDARALDPHLPPPGPRPPAPIPDRAQLDACVHCGFCLPSCPTYMLWGEEMDSPRGRIYLMRAALEGRTPLRDGYVRHFDACLGCMACVTACPSGVQYAPLIEATRAQIELRHRRSAADRLFRAALFAVLPHPMRLRLALIPLALLGGRRPHPEPGARVPETGTRHSPANPAAGAPNPEPRRDAGRGTLNLERGSGSSLFARVRAMLSLAPRVQWTALFARGLPRRTPAAGERRLTVGLLEGCAQRVLFPHVNRATAHVLSAEGCDVVAPAGQGCCGALALHAGRIDEARAAARRTIAAFERAGVDRIAVNAAGCGSSMKEYGRLFADDAAWAARAEAFAAKVRDISELIVELGPARAPRHPLPLRIAYQDACHLAHAQRVREPPRQMLASIPGVELVAVEDGDVCCGSAGIYNLVEPDTARRLGARKAAALASARADLVASPNPGCALQIAAASARAGTPLRIVHPIEILDASISAGSI